MPVRSLHSPLLRWTDRRAVAAALDAWVDEAVARHPDVIRIGVFGSFARGEWAFGSDLDLIVVVGDTEMPSDERVPGWDVARLPVPADLLIYTAAEWRRLNDTPSRFRETLARDARWLWPRPADSTERA